ncbi:glycosyltransferase family 2 protein [Brachybacterium sp. YJGR34]|uniref:glycosyltransferase family 2 protein n=1 Tax=Brachybacterium sp. YJGR34 TaxID=2059911 RepID=UPI000E0ADE75|nr:glycosyltransferase [Brachybacterium sp. YJGR34]
MIPAASIVVPSYRGAARLPALLDSLAAQEAGGPEFEVIVVLDGEDDGSGALLAAEDRVPVRILTLPENRGRAGALNAGFAQARGRVLMRCDDDLVLPAVAVRAQVAAHAGEQPVGVVAPTRDVHTPSPYARAYGEDAAARSLAHALSRPAAQRWRLWAACCSITRDTWERIGPYDTRYRGYGWEDVDYGYRLHAAGIDLVVLAEAVAEHHGPARSARERARRAYASGAARARFRRLHPRAPLPETTPGTGPWGTAVGAAARAMRSPDAAARLGGAADALLPRVPRPVGRKLVALAVEGAGIAGDRAAARDGADG